MDSTLYLLAWLLAALAGIAVLSALLARFRSRQDLRRIQAHQLTQALQHYSAWVGAQRLAAVFEGETPEAAKALEDACVIRRAWFPELANDMADLLTVHNRVVNFLVHQQALWLREPEFWLDSEHDKRFMALWQQHRLALQALLARLQEVASVRLPVARARLPRQSTYA